MFSQKVANGQAAIEQLVAHANQAIELTSNAIEPAQPGAHRTELMADWVGGVDRLRELVTGAFPTLERAFDYFTPGAPVLVTGGNPRRPKRHNRRLRRVFPMAALSGLKVNDPLRAFYDEKRSQRLIHTQALLVLVRRLVDVLGAPLRDGRTFTPTAP